MKILAISGSARVRSTNTALLRGIRQTISKDHCLQLFDSIAGLPVFSPDLEGKYLPEPVSSFIKLVSNCDGLIISSPEYVRSIPGGLKNAIDWLVSHDELVGKPIALLHASHRGDDMLEQLRIVLKTVTDRFCEDIFLRLDVANMSPPQITAFLGRSENRMLIDDFFCEFIAFCRHDASDRSATSAV